MIIVYVRTQSPNKREHFHAKAKRVRKEREAAMWTLSTQQRPKLPCSVILTRVAPSQGLDDDNLVSSLKGVRDQVAEWLGVNDRDRMRVRYRYAQEHGPWGVRIEFGPPVNGAQLEIDAPLPTFADMVECDAFGPIPKRKTTKRRAAA